MNEELFNKTYMDNYVALYQSRAAKALGGIGGKEAQNALREALRAPLREDVEAVVREAMNNDPRLRE